MTKIFPAIIMVLYLCAAAVYGYSGDYRRMTYFLCAFGLNLSITV